MTRDAWVSISELVDKLLENKPIKKGRITVKLQWVMAETGEIHFIHDPGQGRSVLRQDSKIRVYGLEAGLPKRYWAWLCGEKVESRKYAANQRLLEIPVKDWKRVGSMEEGEGGS